MELVEPSHSASMAPLPGSVTGLLSHLITTVRLALKAIGAAAPLLDVSCSGSSWRSLICIDDTEYAGLICCCYQEPQHCVVTKVGRLIGRTFLQSAAPVFVDRCTFFVFTDEPLAKQDQTAPDDFDGTNDRDYRPLLDPLDQPSETAPFAGDRCAQRLKIAAVLTAGAAVYRAQPTPSLHARDAKSLPRAGKVSGSEPATMAEAHARASSAWHKAEADEMQSPFGITGSSAHDRYTHDTPHTHTPYPSMRFQNSVPTPHMPTIHKCQLALWTVGLDDVLLATPASERRSLRHALRGRSRRFTHQSWYDPDGFTHIVHLLTSILPHLWAAVPCYFVVATSWNTVRRVSWFIFKVATWCVLCCHTDNTHEFAGLCSSNNM